MIQKLFIMAMAIVSSTVLIANVCVYIPREPPSFEAGVQLGPLWSSDGSQVMFGSTGMNETDRKRHAEHLYIVTTDGTRLWSISEPEADDYWYADFSPSISPDGSRIAFVTSRHETGGSWLTGGGERNLEIVSSAADGSDYHRLTHNQSPDLNPAWSPDGQRIAFLSNCGRDESVDKDSHFGVCTMASDGSDKRYVTPPSITVTEDTPVWSPDGRRLAFRAYEPGKYEPGRQIILYTVASDGSELNHIFELSYESDYYSNARPPLSQPTWSPEGEHIAFAVMVPNLGGAIYTSRYNGTNLRNVIDPEVATPVAFDLDAVSQSPKTGSTSEPISRIPSGYGHISHLSWSSDGSEVLFLGGRTSPVGTAQYGIQALRVDGSNHRMVANLPLLNYETRVASSSAQDSVAVLLESPWNSVIPGGNPKLYTVDADGSNLRVLVWDRDGVLTTENPEEQKFFEYIKSRRN